ncbi:MAG: hypothetical protein ACR2GP_04490 [Burkholderiaceae bacterium]
MAQVERVQTGMRFEKRILKVLKGIAEMHDLSLGDLLEGICLHVMEGRLPFGDETLATIAKLKEVYGLDLTAADSHRLSEIAAPKRSRRTVRAR